MEIPIIPEGHLTVIIMKSSNNKGFALITLVIAMTLIALIGAGFVSIVGSKQKGFTYLLKRQKANMIARAGVEWAIRFASEGYDVKNVEKNLVPGKLEEGSFTTSYDAIGDKMEVEGKYQGSKERIRLSNFQRYLSIGDVSFPLSTDSFKPVESQAGQSITVRPTGVISLGQGVQNTSGAVWYGGNSTAGNCVNGVCDFGSGFRAYFVFQYAPGSKGDGFTFAITNGTNNTANSVGGDSQMGELMAYGGDSRLYSRYSGVDYVNSFVDGLGNGLRPPKFAVEFDIYPNTSCPADSCGANNRCDFSNEHMAYVFWGDDIEIGCKDNYTRWMSSFSFLANTVVYGTTGGTTYLYRLMNDLKTGTTQPTWPAGKGSTVMESGVQWRECSWRPNTPYNWGDVVAPKAYFLGTAAYGFFFKASQAGSTGGGWDGLEGHWTNCIDSGDECIDGSAKWQNAAFYGVPKQSVNYVTNSRTYEDNKHTAGTGGDAGNNASGAGPTNATSSGSYYTSPTNPTAWLADRGNPSTVNPTYAYRMEVVRDSAAGTYRIKSWIKICDPAWSASTAYAINDQVKPTVNNGYYYVATSAGTSGAAEPTWIASGIVTDGTVTWVPIPMTVCNKYTNGTLGNVRSDYTADSPTLDRTITLDTTYNTAFSKFLFGWTTASGGATQKAEIWQFRLSFKP